MNYTEKRVQAIRSACCHLCRTMACFECNLHNQISSGDSVQSSNFCGNQAVDTTFVVP